MSWGLAVLSTGSTLRNRPVAGSYFRAPMSDRPVAVWAGSPRNPLSSGQVPVPVSIVPYGVEARRMAGDDWLNADTAAVMVPWAVPVSQDNAAGVVSPITCPAKV
jgi:hypothetical protein